MLSPSISISKALLLVSAVTVSIGASYATWNSLSAATSNGSTISGSTTASVSGSGNSQTPGNNGNGNGGGNDNKTFTISGTVTGLYPGVTGKQLPLTLKNNSSSAITVRTLSVSVSAAPSGCASSNLLLGPAPAAPSSRTFSVSISVAKNGTATFTLPITMASAAPNACANKSFGLSYGGQADQA